MRPCSEKVKDRCKKRFVDAVALFEERHPLIMLHSCHEKVCLHRIGLPVRWIRAMIGSQRNDRLFVDLRGSGCCRYHHPVRAESRSR